MKSFVRGLAQCAPWILALACTSSPPAQGPGKLDDKAGKASDGKTGDGKADTATASLDPASLQGRVFLAQKVTEGGKPRALVEGSGLMVSFHEGSRIGASAGCNSLGGRYALEGGALVLAEAAITEKACPNLMDQESWYMGFLESKPSVTQSGDTLVLEGGGTRIEYLDRKVATPDLALVGPTWTVDTIVTKDAASHAAWPRPATMVFEAGGGLKVFAGCNGGQGTYRVAGQELTLESLGLTEKDCADPLANELETAVAKLFRDPQPVTFTITVDRLSLRNEDGAGLDLKASKG